MTKIAYDNDGKLYQVEDDDPMPEAPNPPEEWRGKIYDVEKEQYTEPPPPPEEAIPGLRQLLISWENGDEDLADDRLNDLLQADKTLDLFASHQNYERMVQRLESGPASTIDAALTQTELDELRDYLVVT